jgi:hypothetical protein
MRSSHRIEFNLFNITLTNLITQPCFMSSREGKLSIAQISMARLTHLRTRMDTSGAQEDSLSANAACQLNWNTSLPLASMRLRPLLPFFQSNILTFRQWPIIILYIGNLLQEVSVCDG